MTDSFRLMVFCKAPVPGEVKTRLHGAYTPEQAADIHRELAIETLEQCLELKHAMPGIILELWCSPDSDHEFFQYYQTQGYELLQQSGDDLGERMHNGFLQQKGAGLLIGTDCPPIDVNYLMFAAKQLKSVDVVLAPAEDGGYGLIGLHRPNFNLFENITWSTDTVLSKTIERCESQKLTTKPLPLIWDVDDPDDVDRWRDYCGVKLSQYQ